MRIRLAILATAVIGVAVVNAQEPPARPAFEAASVKQNVSGRAGGSFRVPPVGTITYTNVPLRMLIRDAYQVDAYAEQYLLILGPWARLTGTANGSQADAPRFDVVAKPPANSAPDDRRAMMRTLLEDRFALRVHRETREMPVYAFTVLRQGRLGPNLAVSTFDCVAFMEQRRNGGTAPEPVNARGESWCLYNLRVRPGVMADMRSAGSMTHLIQSIQPYVDRPIIDASGLSGHFEWHLTFGWGPNAPADVPSVFTAVEDQLGVTLEPRRGQVDVLVIDSVALPTPD